MRRQWHVAALVSIATLCATRCIVPTHSITGRFRADVSQEWCVTAEVIVLRLAPRVRELYAEPARIASGWTTDVRVVVPVGSRFRVVKVVRKTSLEFGLLGGGTYTIEPKVVFEAPFEQLGTVNAYGLMPVVDWQNVNLPQLQFTVATPCEP